MYSTSGIAIMLEGGEYASAAALILRPGMFGRLAGDDDYGLFSNNLIRDWINGESYSFMHVRIRQRRREAGVLQ